MAASRARMDASTAADLLLFNGRVLTLDRADRVTQAVATRGDRILALGTDADLAGLGGERTRRIDLAGRTVIPGLVDGHAHMDREGLKDVLPSLAGCRSIRDVLDRIEALARRTPPGEWVVTMPVGDPPFYEGVPGCLAEGRFPNRRELDEVAPGHPVYIRAIWGHWRNSLPLVSVANTQALRRAGVDRDTVPPAPSIELEREGGSGELTGLVYEWTYKPLAEMTLFAGIPRFSLADRVRGLRRSMEVYAGFGTTSVFEGHGVATEVLAAYQALRAEGALPVRAGLMFSPAWPDTDASAVADLLADWGRWLAGRGLGDEYLRVAGLYTESDYSEENLLRARCGPYTGWAGFNFDAALPEETMLTLMIEAARAGIRVGSFSPGILSLFERVDKVAPIGGQRWLIEHIGVFEPDEIARIRDLGLAVQAYSNKWIWQDGAGLLERLGAAGAERVLPMRDLLEAGVPVALATDNVPPTLFAAVWHVVARRTRDAPAPVGPGQALNRTEALRVASHGGAHLSFEEDVKGTLEVGKYADLVVLDRDPLAIEESALPDLRADLTVTGGAVVHPRS